MRSVNKVILLGNLTRDPDIRNTANGSLIGTFGLATNRFWQGADGQKNQFTEYHNLVVFGNLAGLCQKLLKKGSLAYIEGYLKTRSWEHPESGAKIFRTEIVVTDMILLDKKQHGDAPQYDAQESATESPSMPEGGAEDDFFAGLDAESDQVAA